MATVAGLPVTVAPIGLTADGLPIGVQIMGAPFDDRTTTGFAGLIEGEFGGFRPPTKFRGLTTSIISFSLTTNESTIRFSQIAFAATAGQ